MYYVRLLAVALIVIFAVPLLTAQDDSTQRAEQLKAAFQAHKADFDYLLGDWEFTAESRDYGKFAGVSGVAQAMRRPYGGNGIDQRLLDSALSNSRNSWL